MAESSSDLLKRLDSEHSSTKPYTYDEKVTPEDIDVLTGKNKQDRAKRALTAINSAVKSAKEEKSTGPITQPTLKVEEIKTDEQPNKENEEPSINDDDER